MPVMHESAGAFTIIVSELIKTVFNTHVVRVQNDSAFYLVSINITRIEYVSPEQLY